MTEFVRVRDTTTGHQYSIPADAVDHDRHAVIPEPAVDVNGSPLPPAYPTVETTADPKTATAAPEVTESTTKPASRGGMKESTHG